MKCLFVAVSLLSLAATAAYAETPQLPPPGKGEIVSFDVHSGTSMAVAVSPDGKMLAIDMQGSLWVLPVTGGKAVRVGDFFNDARQPVWSPDSKSLVYFGYRDGGYDLWSVKADGSNPHKLTDGPYDDREPVFSPDGTKLAFSSDRVGKGEADYNIWTLDLASGALTQLTSGSGEDRMPTWSPDGARIAFSSVRPSGSAIYAVPSAGGAEALLRESKARLDAPSWGPGGQLAYVAADAAGSHLEIDGKAVSAKENVFPFRVSWSGASFYYVSDGLIRKRTGARLETIPFAATLAVSRPDYVRAKRDWDSTAPRKALGILRPTLSPDGTQVAFTALGDIYILPITGGTPRNVTNDAAMDTDVTWSPDGKQIAYSSDKGGGLPELWVRDLTTGEAKRLTTLENQPLGAAWSPDGKRIAFIDADGRWGTAGVATVDVATGAITRLSKTLEQPGKPSWSPDGKYVALALSYRYSKSFREGTNQIWMLPADGKGAGFWRIPEANVSIDTRGGGGPAWSPDGTKMAAIYEGLLKVWPVGPDGTPLAPPRAYTSEISYFPTWSGDSRKLLYMAADKLKLLDTETGHITEIPVNLTYRLAKPEGRLLLHVGRMIDMVTDRTQPNMDILIEGNRIISVTPHDPALHAGGAKVVDAPNLTAIPGLVEHHAHVQKDFGANAGRAWLAYGITTVRDPGNQPYDGVEERETSEAGVRLMPRIYSNGPLLEWQRVYYKMGVAVAGPAHLERELERARLLKYDVLKSYVRMPDLYQRRMVEAAHEMGVPITGHEIFPAAYSGLDATEHMGATSRRGYSPKQGPQGRAYEDVIQLFGRSHRYLTPTNFGALAPYLAKHPTYKADPRIDLYPVWARRTVRESDPMGAAMRGGYAGSLAALKAMYDAGTIVTAGTDTPIATNLHAELDSYVAAGLTPYQALQTATVNPARSLNLDAGTIAPGKLADIALVEGDPRTDIGATFNTRMVITNGRAVTVEELLTPPKP